MWQFTYKLKFETGYLVKTNKKHRVRIKTFKKLLKDIYKRTEYCSLK